MLLLKSLAQFFLKYKSPYDDPTNNNKVNYAHMEKCKLTIGLIFTFIWLAFCEIFIILRATHNSENFIGEWFFKFFICILCEFIIVDTIKILTKILFNSIWLSMAKSEFVNSSFGKKLAAFVDIIYHYFT